MCRAFRAFGLRILLNRKSKNVTFQRVIPSNWNFYQIQGQIIQVFQLMFDDPNSRDYWYSVYIVKSYFFKVKWGAITGDLGPSGTLGPNMWVRAGFGLPKIIKIRARAAFGLGLFKKCRARALSGFQKAWKARRAFGLGQARPITNLYFLMYSC